MSPWLFNVYIDGVVREVNVMVLGKGLELLSADGGRFELNHLLFADDTAQVADSEEKLCRLVSEFGRVCERRKFGVNVGKRKVMGCSRYGNGGRMHVILPTKYYVWLPFNQSSLNHVSEICLVNVLTFSA